MERRKTSGVISSLYEVMPSKAGKGMGGGGKMAAGWDHSKLDNN
jgi:hypothetical protein